MRKFVTLFAVIILAALSSSTVFAAQINVRTVGVCGSCDTESESPIVWKNTQIGFYFYTIASNAGLYYTKTVDHGLTWGTGVKIQTDSDSASRISNFNVWYSNWTAGNVDDTVHIVWNDASLDYVQYRSLVLATSTLGTQITISPVTAFSNSLTHNPQGIVITQSRGGNLYVASRRSNTPSTGHNFWRSVDDGAVWTSRTKGPVSSAIAGPITAGNETDNQDIYGLNAYGGTAIEIWHYDDSANTWAVIHTITTANSVDNATTCKCAFAVDRGTPNSTWFAIVDNNVSPYAVYVREVVTAASVLTRTTPFDTSTNRGEIALFNDQIEDILYFISTQDVGGIDSPTFTFSEDRGATWEAEVYATTSQDLNYPRLAPTNLTNGGRFTPVFTITGADPVIEDQLNVAVTAVASAVPVDTLTDKVRNMMTGLRLGGTSGDLVFAFVTFVVLAVILYFARAPVYVILPIMVLWAGGLAIAGLLPPWILVAAIMLGGLGLFLKFSAGGDSQNE